MFTLLLLFLCFFFFNDTATTDIYTLSLHDALPIWLSRSRPLGGKCERAAHAFVEPPRGPRRCHLTCHTRTDAADRKSTRLNSSHTVISYAVFCLKKKKKTNKTTKTNNKPTKQPS